jgi:hypothetical protein
VENLRAVTNELAVMPNSSLSSRSSDAIVTSKVKATLFDAKDVQGNAFKVVTERGTVYLMGVVTERELNRATELARSISGVDKVVRVAEVVSEEQLKALQPAAPRLGGPARGPLTVSAGGGSGWTCPSGRRPSPARRRRTGPPAR